MFPDKNGAQIAVGQKLKKKKKNVFENYLPIQIYLNYITFHIQQIDFQFQVFYCCLGIGQGAKGGDMQDKEQSKILSLQYGTPLITTFRSDEKSLKARLVGVDPGELLVIRLPAKRWVHEHLYEGNGVTFKTVSTSTGQVFGFRSNIIGNCVKPHIILAVTTYPDVVETFGLRKETRISCYLPCRLQAANQKTEAVVVDISTSGCRVSLASEAASELFLNLNEQIQIGMAMLGMEGEQLVQGRIKNISTDGDMTGLGLSFENMEQPLEESIRRYTEQVSKYIGN
jgi:c-di-GMP-binding flagellar brake protein YcgR